MPFLLKHSSQILSLRCTLFVQNDRFDMTGKLFDIFRGCNIVIFWPLLHFIIFNFFRCTEYRLERLLSESKWASTFDILRTASIKTEWMQAANVLHVFQATVLTSRYTYLHSLSVLVWLGSCILIENLFGNWEICSNSWDILTEKLIMKC